MTVALMQKGRTMNRREFLRSAALAAASLIARKSTPKVEELEARLEEQDGLLDLWIKHHQNVIDLWEQRCAELEKEAAFYHSLCNSGADRVRSLMEENVQLDRENHDLAFQLWVWSMACGTGEEQQAQRTAELLERRLQREAAGWGADDNALPMREWVSAIERELRSTDTYDRSIDAEGENNEPT